MFLSGDFGYAVRQLVREHDGNVDKLSSSGGLSAACEEIPALADLFRLAVRPEYADARWHPVSPASRRSSSKIKVL
jgi:hypothetical protein